jgi:hypothetical protein
MKRTDVILSVATLATALLAAGVIVATGGTDEFVAWAWGTQRAQAPLRERHA